MRLLFWEPPSGAAWRVAWAEAWGPESRYNCTEPELGRAKGRRKEDTDSRGWGGPTEAGAESRFKEAPFPPPTTAAPRRALSMGRPASVPFVGFPVVTFILGDQRRSGV